MKGDQNRTLHIPPQTGKSSITSEDTKISINRQ